MRRNYKRRSFREDYNGWANWETWNVNLWFDNDEGLYNDKIRFINKNRNKLTPKLVESYVRCIFPDGTPDMGSPREMNKVDWEELTDTFKEEIYESKSQMGIKKRSMRENYMKQGNSIGSYYIEDVDEVYIDIDATITFNMENDDNIINFNKIKKNFDNMQNKLYKLSKIVYLEEGTKLKVYCHFDVGGLDYWSGDIYQVYISIGSVDDGIDLTEIDFTSKDFKKLEDSIKDIEDNVWSICDEFVDLANDEGADFYMYD
jgi:hypothetical protein